jgi:predicted metalloprotease
MPAQVVADGEVAGEAVLGDDIGHGIVDELGVVIEVSSARAVGMQKRGTDQHGGFP